MPLFADKETCEKEVGHLTWPYVDFEKVENEGRVKKTGKKRYQNEWIEYITQYPERKVHFRLFLTDNNGSAYAWAKGNLDQVRKYMARFKVVGYGNFAAYRNCQDVEFAERICELESELKYAVELKNVEAENARLRAELGKMNGKKRGVANVEAA